MRPPPKEAIFLDRKIAGVFAILARLKVIYGPGKLLRSYLEKNQAPTTSNLHLESIDYKQNG
jgi:hypothetical protein